MKIVVQNLDGERQRDIDLSEAVFNVRFREDLIARVVRWQLSRRQRGTHKTKTISEIQGTTKKPYKQKGTGNARQGSLRSGQMRGGATIFGPVVRSHAHSLPKKVRRLALRSLVSQKFSSQKLVVLDSFDVSVMKTKELALKLSNLGLSNALVVGESLTPLSFQKACKNIRGVDFLPTQGANVYDVMRHDVLVLSESAVKELEMRLK